MDKEEKRAARRKNEAKRRRAGYDAVGRHWLKKPTLDFIRKHCKDNEIFIGDYLEYLIESALEQLEKGEGDEK